MARFLGRPRGLAVAGVLLLSLVVTTAAQACVLNGIASLAVNGNLAQRNLSLPTTATFAQWATFIFPRVYGAAQSLTFDERTSDLAQSLPATSLKHPFQWVFGDGSQAVSANGQHTYATPGLYTLTISAWSPSAGVGGQHWFVFDKAQIHIVPAGEVWRDNLGNDLLGVGSFLLAGLGNLFTLAMIALLGLVIWLELRGRLRRQGTTKGLQV